MVTEEEHARLLFPKAPLTCPRCGHAFQAEVWVVVHAAERPNLVEQARQGTLPTATCPACGHTIEVDAPLLLYFPRPPEGWGLEEGGPVVLFMPARGTTAEEDQRDLQALLEGLARGLGRPAEDLAQRLLFVPPGTLPAVLEKGPQALLEALAQAAQQALEELRQQDPETYRQLEEAAREWVERLVGTRHAAPLHDIARLLAEAGDLGRHLWDFINADTWGESRRILEQHPELLSDEADALLGRLIEAARGAGAQRAAPDADTQRLIRTLERHRGLLRRCREVGVDQAFAELVGARHAAPLHDIARLVAEAGDLGRVLWDFIAADTWDASRRILEQHPELLSDDADALLGCLIEAARGAGAQRAAPDADTQRLIRTLERHRGLLRRCREVGVEQAFAEIVGARHAAPLHDVARLLAEAGDLGRALWDFIAADTWDASRRILEQHPELLSDEADALLGRLIEAARGAGAQRAAPDADTQRLIRALERHRDLLRRCREVGVEQAFAEIQQPAGPVDPAVQQALAALPAEVRQALAEAAALQDQAEGGRPHLWQQVLARLEPLLEHPAVTQRPLARASLALEVGNGYLRLYELSGEEALAQHAMEDYRQALRLLSREQAPFLWAAAHHSLGNLYFRRYERSGDEAHARAAEQHYRNALEAYRREVAPAQWATVHHSLGNLFFSRYERSGEEAHARAAEQHYRNALEAYRREVAPAQWATVQHSLGTLFFSRYERSGEEAHARKAREHYGFVLQLQDTLPAIYPFRAAMGMLSAAFRQGDWPAAARAGRQALRHLQALLAQQTQRVSKLAWLREAQALPSRHAYALWRLGRPRDAVEALEKGRAFLLREALERKRRDLERLPALGFADLYRAYQQAAEALAALDALPFDRRPADWFARRRAAREALEKAAAAIREQVGARHPEFRFFLQALPYAEVQALGAGAPIVYLLATEHGGLALVVGPSDEPRAVALPALTAKALQSALGGYLGAYRRWLAQRDDAARKAWFRALEETLVWLGRALAPLVEAIRWVASTAVVTFMPTGWLNLLPLHAARLADGTYLLEHFAIAYAPSAHALYHARLAREGSRALPLLAVENPTRDLPFTPHEVAGVLDFFPREARQRLAEAQATVAAVLQALPTAGVFHFSGHGRAGWGAEESHLVLADGPLPLSRLFDLDLAGVRLAVLSACETGVPDPEVQEEVLGLPAGLLLAGVPGVVGSLWAVNDLSTALLVLRLYHGLRVEGRPGPQALRAAQVWMLRAPAAEKQAFVVAQAPELAARLRRAAAERLPYDPARELQSYLLYLGEELAHPYHWAAFGYYGVPVEVH